ncbi:methyltransferase domain-containing protein [Chondromyces apiculatus]|uniref:Methyltransferase domain-containing protein n=1 Tax=Chondromyces apiculatus DSM 436 TaxID=1192034 RepID=A0A017SUK5_9BACT|nr:class I SAM-dependent methyltransferase [Chondromyces apiculatus]EYF00639.1 Hypothetical protein CAP_0392 [Chondromyces apiculatus DSM 436]
MDSDFITALAPDGKAYARAFSVFLAHTDQKDQACSFLWEVIEQLSDHRVFLDAGAGNGRVTQGFTDAFEHTIAIEPSAHLRDELARACPSATIMPSTILGASPDLRASFVLCSHVLYHVPTDRWPAHLHRMLGWLDHEGELAIILQNPESDCMQMVHHFTGSQFDIAELLRGLRDGPDGERYTVAVETVPSTIQTPDVDTAMIIAGFMLNHLSRRPPLRRDDVRAYVQRVFGDAAGRCSFTCTQDFLRVRRK